MRTLVSSGTVRERGRSVATMDRLRKTKEVRRHEILDAALVEFAELGLHGASVENIARRAGISQPYVFRLFATKKNLFEAVVARSFRETLDGFEHAAEGKRGREALDAITKMHADHLRRDPERLRLHMQAFAACGDREILDLVHNGVRDLVEYVEGLGGVTEKEASQFFGVGALTNAFAALHIGEGLEPWADRLVAASGSYLLGSTEHRRERGDVGPEAQQRCR